MSDGCLPLQFYCKKRTADRRWHPVPAPALEARIRPQQKSGARVVHVTIFDYGVGAPAVSVRLQSADVYSYLRHYVRRFLGAARRPGERWTRLLELYDAKGNWAGLLESGSRIGKEIPGGTSVWDRRRGARKGKPATHAGRWPVTVD